jgi:hypothetical protein
MNHIVNVTTEKESGKIRAAVLPAGWFASPEYHSKKPRCQPAHLFQFRLRTNMEAVFGARELGGRPRMPFFPNSSLFEKNNARNITYMPVHIFHKRLDLRKNAYSRTTSYGISCGAAE